jgi:hypothetical protein
MMRFAIVDHASGARAAADGSVFTPQVAARIAAAIDAQLNGEFAAEWGGTYAVRADGAPLQDGEIEIAIFQSEDVSGAAGYHDKTPDGQPYIHVALDDAATLTSVTAALSVIITHECCETAGDPGANRWADRAGTIQEALETCDRVEDVAYDKDGVSVSDFLLQSAFDPGAPPPYDYKGALAAQDDQTPGGYAITRQQGMQARGEDAEGVSFAMKTRVAAELSPGFKPSAAARRRKNHPSSRTRRRGAVFGGGA